MTYLRNAKFGRLTPSAEKFALHRLLYAYSLFVPVVSISAEKIWPLPDLRTLYDQGQTSACTGFSASWLMSIYNNPEGYDAAWLYHRGQETDNDPNTTPAADNGGYVYAVLDVLRNEGHRQPGKPVERDNGIISYAWVHTIDELRTALMRGPVIFGVPWYQKFMTPKMVNGEYWIATEKSWGNYLGGHAITGFGVSDQRKGVRWVNSWGPGYPDVWISYDAIAQLLDPQRQGECAAPVDFPNQTPPPADLVIPQIEYTDEAGARWRAENVGFKPG